jgi:hypothetical protein
MRLNALSTLAAVVSLLVAGAAGACLPLPPDLKPRPAELMEGAAKVYLGRVRSIARVHKSETLYRAIVEVRETLKGPSTDKVEVFVDRSHCRPGNCPCARLERPGDGVVAYHAPIAGQPSTHARMVMESFGADYVEALRALRTRAK